MDKVDSDVLWEIMFRSLHMKSLCETSIEIKDHIGPESLDINGLVMSKKRCVKYYQWLSINTT